ncbi:hypothetical protein HK100_005378 [Physocladia obscura]|uniref:Nucleotide-diphospho-sugar transferase domain-containing protein n=1 Tax=Physocladia obscura TaxID=109957 RepID=A0AAD5XCC2_9FUNG|nr:hypothetical protein HK100_005378 [Physocladia obscura]
MEHNLQNKHITFVRRVARRMPRYLPFAVLILIFVGLALIQINRLKQIPLNEAADAFQKFKEINLLRNNAPRLPSDFIFEPSLSERPPKRRAIFTALFRANDAHHVKPNDADWFFTNVYLHAYTFLVDPVLRLKPDDDAEFVVMVTDMVPASYIRALLDFGARILKVPVIEIPGREKPGDKYQYLYTKLNMYRLDRVFNAILFVDVDLNFFKVSPVSLFRYVHPVSAVNETDHPHFFASTREWASGNGVFNTGVQLLIPSEFHYQALKQLALDPKKSKYGDQGLLNTYFHEKGPRPWLELPQIWNTNHLESRTQAEVTRGVGFHGKLWSECKLLSKDSFKALWPEYQTRMVTLRRLQMEKLAQAASCNTTIMPIVPQSCEMWMDRMVKTAADKIFLNIALVSYTESSNLKKDNQAIKSHRDFADFYAQASHFVIEESSSESLPRLARQLKKVFHLFDRYDWIWVLDDVVFKTPSTPMHLEINNLKSGGPHIHTFRDCDNKTSGSFIMNKDGQKKLEKYLNTFAPKFAEMSNEDIWKALLEEFTKFGGKRSLKVMQKSEWYEIDSNIHCQPYLNSAIYGERA